MTRWTHDELIRIGTAEELQIASRRRDGTLRKSVIIWVVRHSDDLNHIVSPAARSATVKLVLHEQPVS